MELRKYGIMDLRRADVKASAFCRLLGLCEMSGVRILIKKVRKMEKWKKVCIFANRIT